MITYQVNGEGDVITLDEDDLTYAEALEVEKQVGLGSAAYLQGLSQGTTEANAALFWIGAVKTAGARAQTSFRDSARALPFDQFTAGLNVLKTARTVRRPKAATPDPTAPAGSGSPGNTSPATSEPLQQETTSLTPEPSTSDASPSTSESGPGSGTS